ncbi:iron chelate uptake ABC transporter family permease subunit [Spirillospora sp. CA-255316]
MLAVAAFAVTLMAGQTFYPPGDVVRVVLGEQVPGASFTVGRLRLPRAALAVTAGFAFGLAGVTFQTMLRNPLASPDIIGISSGASAAAAIAIVSLSLGGTQVSVFAIVSALAVALLMYTLAFRDGVAGTRLILIGIGAAAFLDSVTSYVLSHAAEWDLQEALRWLTGSLNGATWEQVLPALVAVAVLAPVLLALSSDLSAMRLGDDTAAALGVRVERTRVAVIVTTFLDASHQIDVLDLLTDLNRTRGTTIVMVLHDLNLAARYADHLIAVADRRLHSCGTPAEVLTEESVRAVFDLDSRIIEDPVSGRPLMLPIAATTSDHSRPPRPRPCRRDAGRPQCVAISTRSVNIAARVARFLILCTGSRIAWTNP